MLSINLWGKIISQLLSMWKHFFMKGVAFWSTGCRHAYVHSVSWHYQQRKYGLHELLWRTGRLNMLMTQRQWSTTLLSQMSLLHYFHFCWHLLHVTKHILPIQQLIKQVPVCLEIKLRQCYRVISLQIIINNECSSLLWVFSSKESTCFTLLISYHDSEVPLQRASPATEVQPPLRHSVVAVEHQNWFKARKMNGPSQFKGLYATHSIVFPAE